MLPEAAASGESNCGVPRTTNLDTQALTATLVKQFARWPHLPLLSVKREIAGGLLDSAVAGSIRVGDVQAFAAILVYNLSIVFYVPLLTWAAVAGEPLNQVAVGSASLLTSRHMSSLWLTIATQDGFDKLKLTSI